MENANKETVTNCKSPVAPCDERRRERERARKIEGDKKNEREKESIKTQKTQIQALHKNPIQWR